MFDAGLGALLYHVFFVELHVTAIENGILWSRNIHECGFHSRQHILYLAQVDVAVDLRGVVGWTTDVMLGETATLEQRYLREIVANMNTHEIAPERTPVSFLALAPRDEISLGVHVIA